MIFPLLYSCLVIEENVPMILKIHFLKGPTDESTGTYCGQCQLSSCPGFAVMDFVLYYKIYIICILVYNKLLSINTHLLSIHCSSWKHFAVSSFWRQVPKGIHVACFETKVYKNVKSENAPRYNLQGKKKNNPLFMIWCYQCRHFYTHIQPKRNPWFLILDRLKCWFV